MFKILLALGAGYLLIVLLAFIFQDRMVFFPQSSLEGKPGSLGLEYEDVWITTPDDIRLHGWFVPGPQSGRPTALFLHGNAGNISHRLDMLDIVYRLGLNCLLVDYRGYGQSQGSPSEEGMYTDAAAVWRWLVESKGVPPEDIVCWGRSLGGPVAARLARDKDPGALIIESTFTSMPELGQKLYPFLPIKMISRFSFPTLNYIQDLSCPLLVVHSEDDNLVPFQHGQRLYKAAGTPKEFLKIQGEHNDGFLTSGETYSRGVRDFLQRLGFLV
ncbi:MAG: alpha/beta hydrolase [Desulfovermiculus sp.]|nr:alpha/beta hydrolase [Desulfovermiculus sp.]